jgi:polyhydroxyalkanoate synthesis regulator phasin
LGQEATGQPKSPESQAPKAVDAGELMSAKIRKILDDLAAINTTTETVRQEMRHLEDRVFNLYREVGQMLREVEK